MPITLNNGERINKINDNVTLVESVDGLRFTTDAYLLSAYVKRPKGAFVRAAELGAGTGVISLLLVSRGLADSVRAFEVQERFCDIMRRNVLYNGFDGKIKAKCADIRDISEASEGGQFDYVFSNPPYMKLDSGRGNDHDEKNIARREVMGGLHDFCGAASRLCRYGGMFYVVYRPERTAELMVALSDNGFAPKLLTYVHPDVNSHPSLLLCAAKRGGGDGLAVTPPLILYREGTREETDTIKKIYKDGSFPEEYRLK